MKCSVRCSASELIESGRTTPADCMQSGPSVTLGGKVCVSVGAGVEVMLRSGGAAVTAGLGAGVGAAPAQAARLSARAAAQVKINQSRFSRSEYIVVFYRAALKMKLIVRPESAIEGCVPPQFLQNYWNRILTRTFCGVSAYTV